jgi:hypothetical protein
MMDQLGSFPAIDTSDPQNRRELSEGVQSLTMDLDWYERQTLGTDAIPMVANSSQDGNLVSRPSRRNRALDKMRTKKPILGDKIQEM